MQFAVTKLDHVSVLITDLDRCRHFYRDIVGLTPIHSRTFDFEVPWFDLRSAFALLVERETPRRACGISPALATSRQRETTSRVWNGSARNDVDPGSGSLLHSRSGRQSHQIIQWLQAYNSDECAKITCERFVAGNSPEFRCTEASELWQVPLRIERRAALRLRRIRCRLRCCRAASFCWAASDMGPMMPRMWLS